MKRIYLSALLAALALALTAQQNNPNTYNALSARVLAVDHATLNDLPDDVSPTFALEVGIRRQFGKYFGLAAPVKLGTIDVGELENISVVGADLLPTLFPLGTEKKVTPYLHAGVGVMVESFEDANHQVPLGLGLNVKLGSNSWFNLQGEYRISNQDGRDNLMAGLGYIYRLTSTDTDGDGVINRDDKCPSLPGPAATNGCPDTDMDGILDADDKCPTTAGSANLQGCPDADMDGVADPDDKCPDTAGLAALAGCPDTDGDGVADPDDECPDLAGTLAGCPDSDGEPAPPACRVAPTATPTAFPMTSTSAPAKPGPSPPAAPTPMATACPTRTTPAPKSTAGSKAARTVTATALATTSTAAPPNPAPPPPAAAPKCGRKFASASITPPAPSASKRAPPNSKRRATSSSVK